MTAETVSPDVLESTRKAGALIESELLRRLAEVKQSHAAACMDVHASTISRFVADDLGKCAHFLAALGLQVAPIDAMMVSQDDLYALEQIAAKYFQSKIDMRRGMMR